MWHMGRWDDPLVTRGGDTRSGLLRAEFGTVLARARSAARGSTTTALNRGGGAASILDHRGTWNP